VEHFAALLQVQALEKLSGPRQPLANRGFAHIQHAGNLFGREASDDRQE
jgi:hypothetical protein